MHTTDHPTAPCDGRAQCATSENAADVEPRREEEYKVGRGGKGDFVKHKRLSCAKLDEKWFAGGACDTKASDDDENKKYSRAENDLLVDNQRYQGSESDKINDRYYTKDDDYDDAWMDYDLCEERSVVQESE